MGFIWKPYDFADGACNINLKTSINVSFKTHSARPYGSKDPPHGSTVFDLCTKRMIDIGLLNIGASKTASMSL